MRHFLMLNHGVSGHVATKLTGRCYRSNTQESTSLESPTTDDDLNFGSTDAYAD
jgi:hypothetical protein